VKPRSMQELIDDDVDTFLNGNDPEPLIEKFRNGIPLYEFESSQKVIVSLLRGQAIRPKGKKRSINDKANAQKIETMLIYVAQAIGAGFGAITNSPETTDPSRYATNLVCEKFAGVYRITPKTLYKHWMQRKNEPLFKSYINFGEQNREMIRLFFSDS